MNARTLIITAGAIVALAAPTVANARMLPAKQPSKHVVKHHVVKPQGTKRPGGNTRIVSPRIVYIYYPAPAVQAATSLEQLQEEYNNDLIAHGLDPIDYGNGAQAPASEPAPAPETPSSDATPQASEASLAAAQAPSTSETVASKATDDLYQDC